MTDLEEPLRESAPLAWRLAPELCARSAQGGESCAWNHRVWQYLRLIGLVGSIEYHAAFYRQALPAVASGPAGPRVLICGAADYAILARIVAVFREIAAEPEVVLVDRCDAPLEMNRWYARRAACRFEGVRCDVRDYRSAESFDAVCGDSFLGRIPQKERPALFLKWRELLRPGGIALVTSRLRRAAGAERVGFTAEEIKAFRNAALRAATAMRDSLEIGPEVLAEHAAEFASRHFTHPVRSPEEICELAQAAGFGIDHASSARAEGVNPHGSTGPSVREGAEFARVVARRP